MRRLYTLCDPGRPCRCLFASVVMLLFVQDACCYDETQDCVTIATTANCSLNITDDSLNALKVALFTKKAHFVTLTPSVRYATEDNKDFSFGKWVDYVWVWVDDNAGKGYLYLPYNFNKLSFGMLADKTDDVALSFFEDVDGCWRGMNSSEQFCSVSRLIQKSIEYANFPDNKLGKSFFCFGTNVTSVGLRFGVDYKCSEPLALLQSNGSLIFSDAKIDRQNSDNFFNIIRLLVVGLAVALSPPFVFKSLLACLTERNLDTSIFTYQGKYSYTPLEDLISIEKKICKKIASVLRIHMLFVALILINIIFGYDALWWILNAMSIVPLIVPICLHCVSDGPFKEVVISAGSSIHDCLKDGAGKGALKMLSLIASSVPFIRYYLMLWNNRHKFENKKRPSAFVMFLNFLYWDLILFYTLFILVDIFICVIAGILVNYPIYLPFTVLVLTGMYCMWYPVHISQENYIWLKTFVFNECKSQGSIYVDVRKRFTMLKTINEDNESELIYMRRISSEHIADENIALLRTGVEVTGEVEVHGCFGCCENLTHNATVIPLYRCDVEGTERIPKDLWEIIYSHLMPVATEIGKIIIICFITLVIILVMFFILYDFNILSDLPIIGQGVASLVTVSIPGSILVFINTQGDKIVRKKRWKVACKEIIQAYINQKKSDYQEITLD